MTVTFIYTYYLFSNLIPYRHLSSESVLNAILLTVHASRSAFAYVRTCTSNKIGATSRSRNSHGFLFPSIHSTWFAMSSPYLPPTGSAPPPPLLAAIAALSASTSPSISMPPPPLPPSIYPYPLPPTNISTPTTDKAKKKAGISKGSGSRRVPSCSVRRSFLLG